jgi:hypothetical protein
MCPAMFLSSLRRAALPGLGGQIDRKMDRWINGWMDDR